MTPSRTLVWLLWSPRDDPRRDWRRRLWETAPVDVGSVGGHTRGYEYPVTVILPQYSNVTVGRGSRGAFAK